MVSPSIVTGRTTPRRGSPVNYYQIELGLIKCHGYNILIQKR